MSYYILPKTNNTINVNPIKIDDLIFEPYMSFSLFHYYNEIITQVNNMCKLQLLDSSYNTYQEIIKIINTYEYIFSKVPGSKFSVSKIKTNSNIFYEFFEISNILDIFGNYNYNINALHISQNYKDIVSCFEILRENFNDSSIAFETTCDELFKKINDTKFDFIFYDTTNNTANNSANIDTNSYIYSLIELVLIILRNQKPNGTTVIKINDIFYKPVIDIIYLLSGLFDKTYIIKPNTSNVTLFEKYIVCKNFQIDDNKIMDYKLNYYKLVIFLKKLENSSIKCILDFDIPYYFMMKLEDINIILGQQQLESIDQLISIFKNKNKDEKIETIRKTNIQKSICWCEKYKIPCNRFFEKTNIFLPITNPFINNEYSKENITNEYIKESNDIEKNEFIDVINDIVEVIYKNQIEQSLVV